MTLNGEEHSGQGKLTMASKQQDLALEAALRQVIRAQYHFRASEQGLLAWDVRRLVRLSRDGARRDCRARSGALVRP